MSTDPIGLDGGLNLYAFAKGSPLHLRDPMGTDPTNSCATGNTPQPPTDPSVDPMAPPPPTAANQDGDGVPWGAIGTAATVAAAAVLFPEAAAVELGAEAAALVEGGEAAETFTEAVDAVESFFGEGSGTGGGSVPVIGRLADTAAFAGRDGFEIINPDGWTMEGNTAWIQSGIDGGNPFFLASPISEGNILAPLNPTGFTVFGEEVSQILGAGYRWVGNYLLPPL